MHLSTSNLNSKDEGYLANIALLYYQEGLNQSDIAKRFGVSRATIINHLRESKERGIVDIRVSGKALHTSQMSRELKDKYKLSDAYIAYLGDSKDDKENSRHTARVAAQAFFNIVNEDDIIGVAWGETVKLISQELPNRVINNTHVCQVIGSMESDRMLSAEDCAIQIANKLGAECHTLHAPAVLSSEMLALSLRQEPAIAKQLERLSCLDVLLTSVGDLSAETHVVSSGILSEPELDKITHEGAVAFICSSFIDSSGSNLPFSLQKRMIAIPFPDIIKTPKRIMVASGLKKLKAVKAALKGGLVTHAILDSDLASKLLNSK